MLGIICLLIERGLYDLPKSGGGSTYPLPHPGYDGTAVHMHLHLVYFKFLPLCNNFHNNPSTPSNSIGRKTLEKGEYKYLVLIFT